MTIERTDFEGLLIIHPKVYSDDRGYFYESFNEKSFSDAIHEEIVFIQDNEAKSTKGVLRGLHYQLPPYAQSKLVRVISGEVLDVVVDIRQDSKTFGKHYSRILSAANKEQMFIPKGFAHAYIALADQTIFAYKCDAYYAPEFEAGIRCDDPSLKIDWILDAEHRIMNDKDLNWPNFSEHIAFKASY